MLELLRIRAERLRSLFKRKLELEARAEMAKLTAASIERSIKFSVGGNRYYDGTEEYRYKSLQLADRLGEISLLEYELTNVEADIHSVEAVIVRMQGEEKTRELEVLRLQIELARAKKD